MLTKYVAKNYKDSINNLIALERIDLISVLLGLCKKINLDDLDKLIEETNKIGNAEASAILLEYKKQQYSIADIDKIETEKFEKAIGAKKLTLDDYKRMFKCKNENGGVIIEKYVGEDTYVEVPDVIGKTPVVKILSRAFNASPIISVTLPESVKEIENYAFYQCNALTQVVLNSNSSTLDKLFFSCNSLTTLDIPKSVNNIMSCALQNIPALDKLNIDEKNETYICEGGVVYSRDKKVLVRCLPKVSETMDREFVVPSEVTTLSDYAFKDCHFESVVLPNSVTFIGEGVFIDCLSLNNVVLPNKIKNIGARTFEGCKELKFVEIPKTVTEISAYMFKRCEKLESLCLHEKIKKIDMYAYDGCNSLLEIEIPNTVTSIGEGAFSNCKSLIKISFNEKLKKTPKKLCYGCTSLKEINLSPCIEKIDEETFYECKGFESFKIPETITVIERAAFGHTCLKNIEIPQTVVKLSGFNDCKSLENVSILGTPEIFSYAFARCSSLKTIIIPDGLTSIRSESFMDSGLVSVEIPGSVTEIGKAVFSRCAELKTVVLKDGITKVAQYAFGNCPKLESIEIPESVISFDRTSCMGSSTKIVIYGSVENGIASQIANDNRIQFIFALKQ